VNAVREKIGSELRYNQGWGASLKAHSKLPLVGGGGPKFMKALGLKEGREKDV